MLSAKVVSVAPDTAEASSLIQVNYAKQPTVLVPSLPNGF